MQSNTNPPLAQTMSRASCALVAAVALVVMLAACGSSSKPAPSSAQVNKGVNKANKHTCEQIEATLSDGPDPEADPVGHAQAQIRPLRDIHTTERTLSKAIDALAAAYQSFSSTNGSNSANSAVGAATKTIEHLCPGIES